MGMRCVQEVVQAASCCTVTLGCWVVVVVVVVCIEIILGGAGEGALLSGAKNNAGLCIQCMLKSSYCCCKPCKLCYWLRCIIKGCGIWYW